MALDSVKTRINTQSLFWAISGPVTALFVTITLYYVIISQYETRKIMRFLWILLRHQRWQWPLKRADARTQMMYLCGLPKYKVKVIEDVPTPARQLYLMNPDGMFDHSPSSVPNYCLGGGQRKLTRPQVSPKVRS